MKPSGLSCFIGRVLLVCALSSSGAAYAIDVGVLAGSSGCPAGSESLYIWIDNEDYRNVNSASGWLGASYVTENTGLQFCRINGDNLRYAGAPEPFMVLRLGGVCPESSTSLHRFVDAENSLDGEWSSSNIPDALYQGTSSLAPDVFLNFCVFPTNAYVGTPFPDIGAEYGVFASSTFSAAYASTQHGSIYMDDEDNFNYNQWCEPNSIGVRLCSERSAYRNYWNIIDGGLNTGINIAKVRDAPPPSCSSVSADASPLALSGLVLLALLSLRRSRAAHHEHPL